MKLIYFFFNLFTLVIKMLSMKRIVLVPYIIEHDTTSIRRDDVSKLAMAVEDSEDFETSVIDYEEIVLILLLG